MTTHNYNTNQAAARVVAQEGKTEFYQDIRNKELERRQQLAQAMTWLRPVDRFIKSRNITRIDALLVSIGATIEASQAADTVLSAASEIINDQSMELTQEVTEIELDYNSTTETTGSVIENR